MTKQEVSERYEIPVKILEEYEKWGLCHEVKKVIGSWQYDDSDLERLSMIMTLHDVGFSASEIEIYMNLLMDGNHTKKQRMEMLDQRRECALDEIHLKEAQLVRLDYLRHGQGESEFAGKINNLIEIMSPNGSFTNTST